MQVDRLQRAALESGEALQTLRQKVAAVGKGYYNVVEATKPVLPPQAEMVFSMRAANFQASAVRFCASTTDVHRYVLSRRATQFAWPPGPAQPAGVACLCAAIRTA